MCMRTCIHMYMYVYIYIYRDICMNIHIATHCNTRHQTVPRCTILHHTATPLQHTCIFSKCTATHLHIEQLLYTLPCNILQHTCIFRKCTATHCILQHTATHCDTLQHMATYCNTLQRTATHCSALQHTATHCNKLQHAVTLALKNTLI